MKWISNADPPLYVWPGDTWYNQKDGKEYVANCEEMKWICGDNIINFPKKTKVITPGTEMYKVKR